MPSLRGPVGRFVSPASVAEPVMPQLWITDNAKSVALDFEKIELAMVTNIRKALAEAAVIIKEGIRHNFEDQGRGFAGGWQELTEKTLANKAAKGTGDNPMLVDVGRQLEAALTDREQLRDELVATELVIGSTDWRTHFFQFGTRKMVARPVVGVSERDEVEIYAIFEFAVAQAIMAGEVPV